jgi:hypothetical protein
VGKGIAEEMRSLSAWLRADHTFWWGERRHKPSPTVRGEIGSKTVRKKMKRERFLRGYWAFNDRRKGEEGCRVNEGKFGRGEERERTSRQGHSDRDAKAHFLGSGYVRITEHFPLSCYYL